MTEEAAVDFRVASTGTEDYRGKAREQYQTVNEEATKTIQSDGPLADINRILLKYKQVGILDGLRETEIQYADISEFTDYADAQRNLKQVEAVFMSLPSKVRSIFNHDVANWLDAAHDPEKREALIEAGFVERPPVEVPPPPVVEPGEAAPVVES